MKKIVIDASVAIKWFIPEVHAEKATRILQKKFKLLTPDLIFAEVGNILWKKLRLKEITYDIAIEILKDFRRIPMENFGIEPYLEFAWKIVTDYQCTVYDSLYVALAKTEEAVLVTADRLLYKNLQQTSLANSLLWIEDIN